MEEKNHKKLIYFLTNRLFLLTIAMVLCFMVLAQRLFQLQIVQGEHYAAHVKSTVSRTLSIPATRGNIYDRYGRPLAVNKTAFNVKFDTGVVIADLNAMIYNLLYTLAINDMNFIDELPITKDEPFEFTFNSASAEERWKKNIGLESEQLRFSAVETLSYLRELFGVSPELSAVDARNIISIRSVVYEQRFRQYNTITLATDVNEKAAVAIEEQGEKFPGIYIDAEPLRYYPEGEYLSHILGYIRPISKEELEAYEAYGYTETDLIGKVGIEKAYELILNGQKGEETVEVTSLGKIAASVTTVPPTKGNDVFLTIDSYLQKKTADILLKNLKAVLISKLDTGEITTKQIFIAMVKSNAVSLKKIINAENDTMQGILKGLILTDNPSFTIETTEYADQAKRVIETAIEENTITSSEFILCLAEQEIISCDDETLLSLHNGTASSYLIMKEKIASDEISPNQTNLDPCTGSVAVVDVETGDVLALVSYPSYDNNMLVNNFNNEYYQQLLNDPTTPLINRSLMERKAPGSTLKMLSAIAGLESGTITVSTKIQDLGIFKSANEPYAKCLVYSRYGTTHGAIDVTKAIEVSCNYFFYETAYRMGNAKEKTTLDSIAVLNDYMKAFGLDDYSGVEIEEYKPKIASPEAKENAVKAVSENAAPGQTSWTDGDGIRSAIGQSYNNYSVIHMAKYIATLANGGTRYKLTLVEGTKGSAETEMKQTQPIIEEQLTIAPENLEAVHKGMLAVTSGNQGTLRGIFKDYPIEVAGKTGTAEESDYRPSHTWFTGFAPYDNPRIAVVVMIPFGETEQNPAPKIAKEIIAEYLGLYKEPEKNLSENTLAK